MGAVGGGCRRCADRDRRRLVRRAPIYRSWAKAYTKATGAGVASDPVGSSAGLKKIQQQAVGFGATDVHPPDKDLIEHGLVALPVAITGISPVVNLPQVQNTQLRLTGEVLGRIFMGEITRWNAPELTALNPDTPCPTCPSRWWCAPMAPAPPTTLRITWPRSALPGNHPWA